MIDGYIDHRKLCGKGAATRPNKGMKLTKLVAAPGWQAGVPLRGRAGQLGAATASQLIPSVRRTLRSAA